MSDAVDAFPLSHRAAVGMSIPWLLPATQSIFTLAREIAHATVLSRIFLFCGLSKDLTNKQKNFVYKFRHCLLFQRKFWKPYFGVLFNAENIRLALEVTF